MAIDGAVVTDFGGDDKATTLMVQADGKILLAGTNNGVNVALARYNSDGSVDNTFGKNGKLTSSFFNGTNINNTALQADGKLFAVGITNTKISGGTRSDAVIAKYNSDGKPGYFF